MNMRTFLGNEPYPARRNDWEGIADAAAAISSDRAARLPDQVAAGAMAKVDADKSIRVMRAMAALWRRVVDREDLPDVEAWEDALGASWRELWDDAVTLAARTGDALRADPENLNRILRFEMADAMRWHLEPTSATGHYPHIWLAHEYAQWERRRAAEAMAA